MESLPANIPSSVLAVSEILVPRKKKHHLGSGCLGPVPKASDSFTHRTEKPVLIKDPGNCAALTKGCIPPNGRNHIPEGEVGQAPDSP